MKNIHLFLPVGQCSQDTLDKFAVGGQIKARIDDVVDLDDAAVRPRQASGEHAGVAHLGDVGAVGIVVRIVEVIQPEVAVRAAFRRADELIHDKLSGRDVGGNPAASKLEPVREPAVKRDDPAETGHDGDVHGPVSPRSVRIPQDDPGFRDCGRLAGAKESDEVFPRGRDKGLQAFPIHHLPGRNGRVDVLNFFFGQVRRVQIKSGKHHDRCSRDAREQAEGIAGGARDIRDVEFAAIPGGGSSESVHGRRPAGQVGRINAQCAQDRFINHGVESPAGQGHVVRVNEHPVAGYQSHDVGGAGTPRPPLLPEKTSHVG